MVHHLIQAYKLIPEMALINPRLATAHEILSFHSQAYLDFLIDSTNYGHDDDEDNQVFTEENTQLAIEFGLGTE